MQKRSLGSSWKVILATVALLATAMALYLQLFERRSRLEENRLSAARLESALAESRTRLKAEILAELRAELAKEAAPESPGDQPLPNAVLSRRESGGGSTLQQVLAQSNETALVRFQESLDSLAREMEQSDRAMRRDLEEIRAEVRRDQDVSGKVLSLLLVALIPLVLHLLINLWPDAMK